MPPSSTGSTGTAQTADCNEPTVFFDENVNAMAWNWDFGDGSAASTIRNPTHIYENIGQYNVTLTRTLNDGSTQTESKQIRISEPPAQPKFFKEISKDTTICDGKTLRLNPYNILQGGSPAPNNVTYLWFPNGETTATIDVTKSGCYSVEVFDQYGQCSRTAKINVKFCLQDAGGGGAERWYFGTGATLEFGINPESVTPRDPLADHGDLFEEPDLENPIYIPIEPTRDNPIDSPEGVAMVFDPKGELVLYTDGVKIYGKDDQPLPFLLPPPNTATALPGTNTATQSSIIVPKATCNECPHHLYYVYTLNETTGRLSYSIVDLRRNNGQGAVVENDIPVSLSATEQIVARKNQDETAFFVYSQDSQTGQFKVLKIDSTGTSQVAQPDISGKLIPDEAGYMKISPTGDKLANVFVKNGKNYIEIYAINATTGVLELSKTIDIGVDAPPRIYGVEFSSDSEKLYITLRGDVTTQVKSYLYQLNLNLADAAAIAAQKIKIDESATAAFGALQMGPTNTGGGGAIYMAIDGSDKIAYISQPDAGAVAGNPASVGYISVNNGFGAEVLGTSHFGFPNVVHAKQQQDGDGLSATFEGTCQNQPTIFKTQGVCSPMKSEVSWDFGDGSTAKGQEVSHTYTKVGQYTIKMTVEVFSETALSQVINVPILGNLLKEKCNTFVVTDVIYIKPLPQINLADSAYACFREGATLLLDPKAQNTVDPTYLWKPRQPFETTPTITADVQSTYTVDVTNNFESQSGEVYTCTNSDRILVEDKCDPRLFVPEAFTPNGDGVNDLLDTPNKWITDYDLKIYNRWGEIIFESFDPEMKWDGSYKGQIMAPMLYAFIVSYKSEHFPERPKITKTGGILLVK